MKLITALTLVLVATVFAASAFAGPDWLEGTVCTSQDAGSSVSMAQVPMGSGQLGVVGGALGGNCGNGRMDFEDVYKIHIDDPMNFRASTRMVDGGGATFDTMMFLFTETGHGLLANDDASPTSLILSMATDSTGQTIPGPGDYLLAISGYLNVPRSDSGDIFNFMTRTEISGPDGNGAGIPFDHWSSMQGETGEYQITLVGASFPVPEPATIMLLAGAAVGLRRRMR